MTEKMAYRHSEESYHLPRWPMVRQALRIVLLMLAGLILVLFTVFWPWNLIGIAPILWAYGEWRIQLKPKLEYVVRITPNELVIDDKRYPWDKLQALKVEQEHDFRQLRLTFALDQKPYDVTVSDRVLQFDDLVHSCFFRYMALTGVNREEKT